MSTKLNLLISNFRKSLVKCKNLEGYVEEKRLFFENQCDLLDELKFELKNLKTELDKKSNTKSILSSDESNHLHEKQKHYKIFADLCDNIENGLDRKKFEERIIFYLEKYNYHMNAAKKERENQPPSEEGSNSGSSSYQQQQHVKKEGKPNPASLANKKNIKKTAHETKKRKREPESVAPTQFLCFTSKKTLNDPDSVAIQKSKNSLVGKKEDDNDGGNEDNEKAPKAKKAKRKNTIKQEHPAESKKSLPPNIESSDSIKKLTHEQEAAIIFAQVLSEFEFIPTPIQLKSQGRCSLCNNEMVLSTNSSEITCKFCHITIPHIESTASSTGYGDQTEMHAFTYQRMNYFNEKMKNLFKSNREIDKNYVLDVTNYWYEEMKAKGFTEDQMRKKFRNITGPAIFHAINKCGKESSVKKKMKNSVVSIYCVITEKDPPKILPEHEGVLRSMFQATQEPYKKYAPERHNYMGYGYALYKFCQMLGLKDWLQFISMLKGWMKISAHEEAFSSVCKELKWRFFGVEKSKTQFKPSMFLDSDNDD